MVFESNENVFRFRKRRIFLKGIIFVSFNFGFDWN